MLKINGELNKIINSLYNIFHNASILNITIPALIGTLSVYVESSPKIQQNFFTPVIS